MNDKTFVKVAAVAAFLLVLTTASIHFFVFPVETIEQRAKLARNPLYHLRAGVVVIHCLLCIVSLYGVVVARRNSHTAATHVGMIFFVFFGFTEILRTILSAVYANGLRVRYLEATSETAKALASHDLELWSLMNGGLFVTFILSFAIGNLFYGIALFKDSQRFTRFLGYGFMVWSMLTLLATGNFFWENAAIETVVELNNLYFQPLIRLSIGIWLWRHTG